MDLTLTHTAFVYLVFVGDVQVVLKSSVVAIKANDSVIPFAVVFQQFRGLYQGAAFQGRHRKRNQVWDTIFINYDL